MDQTIILYIGVPIMGWLALTTIQHGKRIEAIQTSQSNMTNIVTSAMESVKDLKSVVEKLTNKIDNFMFAEKESFKEIVRENTQALNKIADK